MRAKPFYKRRDYEPCSRFMEAGGIYGRCTRYPWVAFGFRRIFSTAIHVSLKERCRNSENTRALNNQEMRIVFAYRWRPRPNPVPPPPRKSLPSAAPVEMVEWRKAA